MTRLPWSTNEADCRAAEAATERERLLMIAYPFPVLDGDAIALLRLPKHLHAVDAARIKNVIDTLVTADAPEVCETCGESLPAPGEETADDVCPGAGGRP